MGTTNYTKTKNFSISRKARWSFGGLFLVGLTTLLIATLSFQQPMAVYASIDPGLDSGNATVDRTSVPGQTILKYTTTGNSTFKAPAGVTDVRVLVVAGGGGGGNNHGGGGGAGELYQNTSFAVTPGQSVTVGVGSGGTGATTNGAAGGKGGNSAFGSVAVNGGGGGGGRSGAVGQSGGSGGGGAGNTQTLDTRPGGSSVVTGGGQGNNGGNGAVGAAAGSSVSDAGAGGGGGGAGSAGASAASKQAGNGGTGVNDDITGATVGYSGGGAAGAWTSQGIAAGAATHGGGGGAAGSDGSTGGNAIANTGAGGGGGGPTFGKGGSGGTGIVVVRFATQEFADPGGVAGAAAWYKADSAGNTNAQWTDASGFNNTLTQGTAGNQPALTTNSLNFNPAYVFDGTDDVFNMPNNSIAAGDSMSAFYAANSTTAAGGDRYFGEFGDDRPSITIYNGKPRLYVRDTSSVDDVFSTIEAQQPRVYSFVSPNGGGTKVIGVDNREETKSVTGNYTTGAGSSANKFGGKNVSAGTSWQGPIGEAIFFNRALSAVERQKVNSYLAIKWGVTLGTGSIATDYYDSAAATIWPADNTYKSNIAGIGRDDTSTLNQKQSKSTADGSLVTIGHGDIAASNQANANNFAGDKTFMIWGHDTGVTDQATAVSGTSLMRMGRVWKMVVTNTVGAVKVQVPTSAFTRSNATLLTSSSATFDGSSTQTVMSVNGANYEATTILGAGTHYFTFASESGADLQFVSKTATDVAGNAITSYTPGQPLKYHLNVQNNGPDDASTLTVTDTLPTGIVPKTTGATGSGWSCSVAGQTVTCTRPSLASGTAAPEVEIEANIASSVTGQKVNTASVSSATSDPNNTNNSASVTLDATPKADLSITKAHSGTPVAGGSYNYDFVVTNDGPSDVSTFTVTDTLDANLTFASSTPEVTCTGTTSVSCGAAAPLAAGDTRSFSITVNVGAGFPGGSINNQATVAVPAGTTDPNAGNNTSNQDQTGVTVSTDLAISKTHAGSFTAGTNGTFTINVTNNGPSDAPTGSITVTDVLDEDFAFVSATGTNWTCANSNGTVTCTYGATLISTATSSNITLTVGVDSIADTPTDNTASVAGTTPDPTPGNNSSTDTVAIVAEADLALTKAHVGTAFTPGTNEQYTFSVVNNGPSADSPSYQITDTLPAGLTYVSSSGAADCSPSLGTSVVCNGGAIGAGDPAQVTTITVAVDGSASGSFNNSATVAVAAGVTDPVPANNTDSDTVTIEPNADLAIAKDPAPTFVAGSNADYTITVTNNGPSNVSGYTVTDTLDANLSFVSSSPAICSAVGQAVTCNGNAVTNGNNEAITLTVAVVNTATTGASINNTATVATLAGTNDPTPGNNSDTVSNIVSTSADLAVIKTHVGNFDVGGSGNFTISATNNGPSDADTVTITDVLPAGLTYVSATSPDASCNNSGQTVTCSAGPTVSNGQTVDITLNVTVDADVTAATIDNTASVSSATPDPTPGNNSDTDTVTLDPATADLAATKTLQGTMTAGEAATYRFEITNNGPDNAGVITISDTLEPYLSYQSFSGVSGSGWNCSATGQDVTCTLPLLNNGDTASVDVTVLVAQDAPATADNSALVTFNGTDASINNPATTNDPISHTADLDLEIAFDSEIYQSGEMATLTYTVMNYGSSAAEAVVLADILPDGLTFESVVAVNQQQSENSFLAKIADTVLGSSTASAAPNTPFSCSNGGQNVTCSANELFTGTYTITLTARIANSFTGNLTSAAQLTSATFDPNGATVTATATANVVAASGLAGTGQAIIGWIVAAIVLLGAASLVIWRKHQAARG